MTHRERGCTAPRNTLMAFRQSLEAGDIGIEFDVTHNADCDSVVIHDDTLEITTNGQAECLNHIEGAGRRFLIRSALFRRKHYFLHTSERCRIC